MLNLVGWVAIGVSAAQLLPLATALYYAEPVAPFLVAGALSLTLGLPVTQLPVKTDLRPAETIGFVVLTWAAIPLLGSIPYLVSGTFPTVTDALFESVSGFTTTGSTVLTDFDQPRSIMMWRQFTQWIGGMGIIVLFIAILPRLSIGGRQLMEAEAPGPSLEKLTPKIRDTAKLLWLLYVGLTVLQTVLLYGAGESFYDSLAHALTTMPTGGFSPRPGGLTEFSLTVKAIVTVFIFIAGANFALLYRATTDPRELLRDSEFRFYTRLTAASAVVVSAAAYLTVYDSGTEAVVNGAFQAATIITSTGFASADFAAWPGSLQAILFVLMFTGGSAGSTGGGIKMVRILVLLKLVTRELRHSLHPRAILPLTLDGKPVSEDAVRGIAAFLVAYVLLFLAGTAAVSLLSALHGLDLPVIEAATASIAALGNIGPGLGSVGPLSSFAHLPADVKWVLSFLMIAGRLEVLTVLLLLTPAFWRNV